MQECITPITKRNTTFINALPTRRVFYFMVLRAEKFIISQQNATNSTRGVKYLSNLALNPTKNHHTGSGFQHINYLCPHYG